MSHFLLVVGLDVIVTHQMTYSVYEQIDRFTKFRMSVFNSLSFDMLNRYENITQKTRAGFRIIFLSDQ